MLNLKLRRAVRDWWRDHPARCRIIHLFSLRFFFFGTIQKAGGTLRKDLRDRERTEWIPRALWRPWTRNRLICLFGELLPDSDPSLSSRRSQWAPPRFALSRRSLMSLRLEFLEYSGEFSLSLPPSPFATAVAIMRTLYRRRSTSTRCQFPANSFFSPVERVSYCPFVCMQSRKPECFRRFWDSPLWRTVRLLKFTWWINFRYLQWTLFIFVASKRKFIIAS